MTANPATAEMRVLAQTAEAERGPRAANVNDMSPASARSDGQRRADPVGEMHTFLEHRSRQWSNMLRLLEQQRLQVQAVESERDAEYRKLALAVEAVDHALQAVSTVTDTSRENRVPGELEKVIEGNRIALDQLETVAANLNTNFLAWRSAWLQYAQSFEASKRMHADIESRANIRG